MIGKQCVLYVFVMNYECLNCVNFACELPGIMLTVNQRVESVPLFFIYNSCGMAHTRYIIY